ncbi:hypothetical protein cypCar_00042449, partial [Cyprinus carpio]
LMDRVEIIVNKITTLVHNNTVTVEGSRISLPYDHTYQHVFHYGIYTRLQSKVLPLSVTWYSVADGVSSLWMQLNQDLVEGMSGLCGHKNSSAQPNCPGDLHYVEMGPAFPPTCSNPQNYTTELTSTCLPPGGCTCIRGNWACSANTCPAKCIIEGQFITTFDGKQYSVLDKCTFVAARGLNWTLNIQYSGQGVVIEKAYLNINQACVKKTCQCSTALQECLCVSFGNYAKACAMQGINVGAWRSETNCIPLCMGNLRFAYAMLACNHTCRSLSGPDPTCEVLDDPVEGCGCTSDSHLSNQQTCSPRPLCSCHHPGGDTPPGPVVIGGRQCLCENGQLHCPKVCRVCEVFGNGQYHTFDSKWYRYDGHCQYTLVKGAVTLMLSDMKVTETSHTGGALLAEPLYSIQTVGLYIIISVPSLGITVIWDKHTRVTIQLEPQWR